MSDYLDWMAVTGDDETRMGYAAPFRELRPPAIPPAYRNYEPAPLFAHPQNPIRQQGMPVDGKPPVDLAPSTLAKGRESSLKKRRRRTAKQETAA